MPMFVHLAPASVVRRIRRNGISAMRHGRGPLSRGVFAVPVLPDFYISHQWLRELKRRGGGTIIGVYFRVPEDEAVWTGHYGQGHQPMSAAAAVAAFLQAEKPEGWEVIIPRRIFPQQIHRIHSLPQVVGWRYFPGAKGKPPFCTCRFCTRGEYGAQRLRERFGSPE